MDILLNHDLALATRLSLFWIEDCRDVDPTQMPSPGTDGPSQQELMLTFSVGVVFL